MNNLCLFLKPRFQKETPMRRMLFILITLLFFQGCRQSSDLSAFVLVDQQGPRPIFVDVQSDSLLFWAVEELAEDIESVTGLRPGVTRLDTFGGLGGIYVGTRPSGLIGSMGRMDENERHDQWETFRMDAIGKTLIITGSDVRGTLYGIFELSERIGVSPWKWWADVVPRKKKQISIELPSNGLEQGPSVRYRGIFLNDEDWGLHPWAAQTFEPETGDIGPKTYEKIFQLLLRLKANTLWPAMHDCTKAFFSIPGNREMAARYHIVLGSSHAEPMLRNNVDEWNRNERGDYNYFTNRDRVKAYWQERLNELKASGNEFIITLGMRGIHDSRMEGPKNIGEQTAMLEQIICDQRDMLAATFGQSAGKIPQVLIPYKEVLDVYENGLDLPNDITLMWTDDNYGYIRRFPNETEQKRPGGGGVYYHISYWGRPHDYLWLSTTQPGLIAYEMNRAYQNGAQNMWILNVGDIKPAEYLTELFLDLAWNINSIDETKSKQHTLRWAEREFGPKQAKPIADMMDEYYRLAFLRKPEYMGWSQTEPSTKTQASSFSLFINGPELDRRIALYQKLEQECRDIKDQLPEELYDSFFQLIEYPIRGAAKMNEKFLYYQKAQFTPNATEKETLLRQSANAYNEIQKITDQYNTTINQGKWLFMMSATPRNLPAFKMPDYSIVDSCRYPKPSRQEEPIFIPAYRYSRCKGADGYRWKTIEGLGYSNMAISLSPPNNICFEKDLPFVDYSFSVKQPGTYVLEVRCLPTHANDFNHELTLQIDHEEPIRSPLNTRGRSEQWKINVLRNYASVHHRTTLLKGRHRLKLSVNQPGIVLDQIAIYPEDYPPFYEIPVHQHGKE